MRLQATFDASIVEFWDTFPKIVLRESRIDDVDEFEVHRLLISDHKVLWVGESDSWVHDLAAVESVRCNHKLFLFELGQTDPLEQSESVHLEVALIPEPLIVVHGPYRTVHCDKVSLPVEGAPDLEETPENIHRGVQLLLIVVEYKYHQNIESIGGHAGSVGSEETRLVGEPRLNKDYGLLKKMIFRNKAIKEGHEVQSAQTSKLTDRDVNKESLKIKFDDLDICLINK